MSNYVYSVKVPILAAKITKIVAGDDVQVSLTPGDTITTAQGSVAETLAGCHPTLSQGEEVSDALKIFAKSPSVAGSTPDCILTPVVDGSNFNDQQQTDISLDRNMAPWPTDVDGGPFDASGAMVGGLEIGKSLSKMANDILDANLVPSRGPRGSLLPINTALKVTGWKSKESLTVSLTSQAGYDASAGNPGDQPALVLVYGEILTKSYVGAIEALYNGQVMLANIDRELDGDQQINATHDIGGLITMSNWDRLPGGKNQKGVKIYRKITFATNGVATNGNGQEFRYTRNTTPLGGGSNNIAAGVTAGGKAFGVDSDYDLGFLFKQNKDDAFILEQFGIRWASDLAYVGWTVDSHRIPSQDQMNGLPIFGEFTNPYQYGAKPGASNVYLQLPKYQGRLSVYKQNAVPFVRDSGTAISKGAAYIALAGPYIESVG